MFIIYLEQARKNKSEAVSQSKVYFTSQVPKFPVPGIPPHLSLVNILDAVSSSMSSLCSITSYSLCFLNHETCALIRNYLCIAGQYGLSIIQNQ